MEFGNQKMDSKLAAEANLSNLILSLSGDVPAEICCQKVAAFNFLVVEKLEQTLLILAEITVRPGVVEYIKRAIEIFGEAISSGADRQEVERMHDNAADFLRASLGRLNAARLVYDCP